MKLKNLAVNYDKVCASLNNLIIPIFVFVDRATKNWAVNNYFSKFNSKYLSFKLLINRGVSFGAFHFEDNRGFFLVSLIVLFIICFLLIQMYKKSSKQKSILPETLILSGAISNFIDRILFGGVIDFIVFPFDLFVFNIADVSIAIGTFLLFIELW